MLSSHGSSRKLAQGMKTIARTIRARAFQRRGQGEPGTRVRSAWGVRGTASGRRGWSGDRQGMSRRRSERQLGWRMGTIGGLGSYSRWPREFLQHFDEKSNMI